MDCPTLPSVHYSEFAERFLKNLQGLRVPMNGSAELTERCNLDCAHCLINRPAADEDALGRELTCGQWCDIIDEIVDAGCLWFMITSGEPLLRPDFIEIYTYAKRAGLLITLFTNGTTITEAMADYLAEWTPFAVEITLYGATRRTFETVTRTPGSYDKCIAGVRMLVDRGLPLKLKTMVLTTNAHELPAMRAFARDLGCEFRHDPGVMPRLDGGRGPLEYRLDPETVVALDQTDEDRWRQFRRAGEKHFGPRNDTERIYQCGAGVCMFHLDAYGRLSPCLTARDMSCDVTEVGFQQGWDGVVREARDMRWTTNSPCRTCELSGLCGQCPGLALLEAGDRETPVEYLCTVTRPRAQALGLVSGT